jgi:hypothetical protein
LDWIVGVRFSIGWIGVGFLKGLLEVVFDWMDRSSVFVRMDRGFCLDIRMLVLRGRSGSSVFQVSFRIRLNGNGFQGYCSVFFMGSVLLLPYTN